MKPTGRRKKGIVKGAPSGVAISLMVHAGAFLLAGLLVVFTVQKKAEQKFAPPKPVERPKMKLKKPKVKVKKNAKPKATTRIVTKVQKADMPDIQLPELGGMGTGLEGGMGTGFDLLPDLSVLSSPFGTSFTTGDDLKGYFYNFNRDRTGRPIPMNPEQMQDVLYAYLSSGWKNAKIARFYRSPEPLYSPTICVPTVMSELAPQAFGEKEAEGYCWAVIYEGKLVYPEDITFRFWGVGDKFMAVNVDGETVLICAYKSDTRSQFSPIWDTNDIKDNTYYFGEHRARPSDWITLKAGEPQNIKVLMADLDGGLVYHMLSVEVKGEDYPNTRAGGGPTFPVFRTGEISRDMRDVIYSNLYPGDTCLTNGPIFRDYTVEAGSGSNRTAAAEAEPEPLKAADLEPEPRVWTGVDGTTIEARYVTVIGDSVVLENSKERKVKLPLNQLSRDDLVYIDLVRPPRFDLNFLKKSSKLPNPPTAPWGAGVQRPLQMFKFNFGVQVKQEGLARNYTHELKVEYIAVGKEIDGQNYVLLEHRNATFNPADYGKEGFEFRGDGVELRQMAYRDSAPMRGTKYFGHVVTLTDERGVIIEHTASHDFLFDILPALKKLKPNNHFDSTGKRVMPARPTEDSRGPGAVDGN